MIDTELPRITRWSDLDGIALTPAEETLIDAAKAGEVAAIGKVVPTIKTDTVLIRAPLLRYLILGGCDDCRTEAAGVRVAGAWIEDTLDLDFAKAAGPIWLYDCHIAAQPQMIQLGLPGLLLNGSHLPNGLNAQGARVGGNVFLRRVKANGEVHLAGARITGQLDCDGATLENDGGHALNAQGAQVGDAVFLRGLTAKGEVGLVGARITVQLDCEGATLENEGRMALNLQRASVKGSFLWRDVKQISGAVDLTSARVGDLVDDAASWAKCSSIKMVGLTYDVLHGSTDVQERLAWLKKAAQWNGDFYPQLYEQLAKVLRESGHRAEARDIAVEKEIQQRKAVRRRRRREWRWRRELSRASLLPQAERDDGIRIAEERTPPAPYDRFTLFHPTAAKAGFIDALTLSYAQQDFRNQLRWANTKLRLRNLGSICVDAVFRLSVGYGYRPERSIYALVILIGIGWFSAHQAWEAGDFAPNSDVILTSTDWKSLADDRTAYPNPAATWSDRLEPGEDYETFHPVAYAVDIVIPIISLGQEAAWAPSTNRGWWGRQLWWLEWVLTALGWIVTAIGAAAVTGIIRRD